MSNKIIIHKNRTNKVVIDLGIDVSADTITSEIRAEQDHTSQLIATFVVAFESDGTDGRLVLTLDNSVTGITVDSGYMDLKRVSAGEPLPVLDKPLEVRFQGTVTA